MTVQTKITRTILLICTLISILFAQNRPFPQDMNFDNCIKPGFDPIVFAYWISEYYKSWKGAYLKPAVSTPEGYYIYFDDEERPNKLTVSEGQGYGMLTFALMAGTGDYADPEAKKYFDGMYKFFRAHPSSISNNLMTWVVYSVNNDGSGGEKFNQGYTATDGDLDIAYALLLAHYQWGSDGPINYLEEAKTVISAIKQYEMNPNNKRVMICGGSNWSNPSEPQYWVSRTSDWMAGHFHTYYDVTEDPFWNEAANTIYSTYSQLSSKYSPQTGLVPDFINDEDPKPHPYSEGKTHYSFDACRFPWRIAADYAHHGTAAAKTVLNKISNWIISSSGGDVWKVWAEYELNGTAIGDYNSTAFTSPFVTACMADASAASHSFMDKGWSAVHQDKEGYYEDTINLLCMLLMSGNWWKPEPYTDIISDSYKNSLKNRCLSVCSNNSTHAITLRYTLTSPAQVTLGVIDTRGRLVQQLLKGLQNSGSHSVPVLLANDDASSGVYMVGLTVDGKTYTKKFSLVK